MKILAVSGRNLNSLRGNFSVDFATGVFAGCGLFAITGPTGAGKTTLLDAITLALYGCTPRQKLGAALMSYGTGESWAEVVYETSEGRFRTRWEQTRARKKPDGNLQPPLMQVSREPGGDVLTQKKTEAEEFNARLTGLTYEQFTRSVLLAQGGFTQFLKASANDRAALLERMTGTDHYRRLSEAAFQAWKAEADKENNLRAQLGGVVLLTDDERAALEAELVQLEAQVTETKAAEEALDAQRRWHATLHKLTTELAAARAAHAEAEAAQAAAQPDLQRLAAHQQAAPFAGAWSGVEDADHRAATLRRDILALDEQLRTLEINRNLAKTSLDKAEATAAEKKYALDSRKAALQEAIKEFSLLQQFGQVVAEEREKAAQLAQEQTDAAQRLTALETRSAQERADFARLTQWLAANSAAVDLPRALNELTKYLADWEAVAKAYRSAAEQRKRLQKDAETAATEQRQHETQQREATQIRQTLTTELAEVTGRAAGLHAALTERLANGRRHDDTLVQELKTQEELLLAKRTIASFDEHRAALKPHAPCPLCGALDHPYAHGLDVSASALHTLADAVDRLKAKRETVQAELRLLEQGLSTLGVVPTAAPELIVRPETAPAAAWQKLAAELVGQLNALPLALGRADAAHAQAAALAAKTAARQAEVAPQLAQLDEQLAELKEDGAVARQNVESIAQAWQTPFDRDAPEKLTAALQERAADFGANQQRYAELQLAVRGYEEQHRAATDNQAKITTAWQAHQLRLTEKETELTTRTAANAPHYVGYPSPEAALRALETAHEQAGKIATEANDHYLVAEDKFQRTEQERTIKQKALADATTDHAQRLADLRAALQQAGLAIEPAELAKQLLPETERRELDAHKQQLATALATAAARVRQLATELQTEQQRTLTTESPAEITARWEVGRDHHHALHGERGKRLERLEADTRDRLRHTRLHEAVEAQRRETLRWRELSDLMGAADGKKFSEFAQSLTLERLTGLANHHLRYLCDRYRLRRVSTDPRRPLDLLIIDRYQADFAREVSTLSGGESFLVSLALALGLAELASSGTARLDSLFIDEGFGTLDADALDVALSALENLQARGKTIGIISHVDALKERITTQIVVEKGSDGFSTLRVLPEVGAAVLEA